MTDSEKHDDKKPKHPETIIADKRPAAERTPLIGNERDAMGSYNREGSHQQYDTYPSVDPARPNHLFTGLMSYDIARHQSKVIGEVFYEVNSAELAKADSRAGQKSDANLNDGLAEVRQTAQEIINALSDPSNKGKAVMIVGHASSTGSEADNEKLSVDRANAVKGPLLEELNRLDPSGQYLSRITQTTEGVGAREHRDPTSLESTKNRSTTIELVSENLQDPIRTYEVLHYTKQDVERHQQWAERESRKSGSGVKANEPFDFDLGQQTAEGAKFAKTSLYESVSSRGAFILEDTDLTKPIRINVGVEHADDFRLLVRDSKAKISYIENEDHTVSVTADNKVIANLQYNTADKGPLKYQDILVGTVDAAGHTTAVEGLSREEQVLKKIMQRVDANDDKIITQDELDQYSSRLDKFTKAIGGAERVVSKPNGDLLVYAKVDLFPKSVQVENGAQFDKDILAITGKTSSHYTGLDLNKNEIHSITEAQKMMEMLTKGGFEKLKEGMAVKDFTGVAVDAISAVATPRGTVEESKNRGGGRD